MKAVASQRSSDDVASPASAIVATQRRGASLPLHPQVGQLMGCYRPVMDCTTHGVDSQKHLATTSQMAAFYKTYWLWLWVLLLTIFLSSSGAYSVTDTLRSEEGRCRYDLTSIAVLSCMQSNGVWKPSSHTCCNALLYAIDQVPASHESGACCLCRYMIEKRGPPELPTTYIMCNGKDRHIISKWSTSQMDKCLAECTKTDISFVDADSEVVHVHDTGKGIWIAVAVFSVMALICFCYFWRSAATNASDQRRTSPRAERRRSVVPASSPSKKNKERRFSSS